MTILEPKGAVLDTELTFLCFHKQIEDTYMTRHRMNRVLSWPILGKERRGGNIIIAITGCNHPNFFSNQ